MSAGLRIACIGEAMIEMVAGVVPGQAALNVAGDTLNTAIYLRRALPEAHEVSFVSALGVDHLSDQMISFMRSEGVQTERIVRDEAHLPGIYSITTDPAGERTFQYWRENSAARLLFQKNGEISFDALEDLDLLYTSAITLAILPHDVRVAFLDWVENYRSRGGLFSFDSNFRPHLWESHDAAHKFVERAWLLCDIALPSIDDEMALFGDKNEQAVLTRFKTYESCKGALKRGELGPLPINVDLDKIIDYPKAHFVVDTTAAGDSFSGAFLGSYLTNGSVDKAMELAHNYASQVIGHRGAIVPRK